MLRLIGLMLAVVFASPAEAAEPYPNRVIKIIIPTAPGGLLDGFVRMIGDGLQAKWGQPVVMEFRSGAGGVIGAQAVASSPPDGYTLLMGNIGPLGINPGLYKDLPYDAKKFVGVATVASFPNVLVVPPSSPINSVKDLIDLAKQKPRTITYASSGIGQSQHLSGELFQRAVGVEMIHVPYRGSGGALNDLLAGVVDTMFSNVPATIGQMDSKLLKSIAVTSPQRIPRFPDIPTVAESGVPGFEVLSWATIVAPEGTPKEIVDRLNAEIVQICTSEASRRRYTDLGATPSSNSPAQTDVFMEREREKWSKLIKEANITVDPPK